MIGLARLGRDAELRSTTSGDQVATLSLAFNYGKKSGAENRKPTQWVEAALWGTRAEALIDYLQKGVLLCVALEDPHIETFDSRGETKSKLVAKVANLEFADSPSRAAAPPTAARPPAPAPRPAARAPAPAPATRTTSASFDDMDDDIPF